MDMYRKRKRKVWIMIDVFLSGVLLQIVGQRIKGYPGLSVQLFSLLLLLADLYVYNKEYE